MPEKENHHIYKGHTLEEYNKKYSNLKLKVAAKVDADNDPKLLENKSWWLIEDKYYEVPNSKCPPVRWWKNLNTTGRVITCILGAVVIATAVAVPVALTMNQTQNYDISVGNIDKVNYKNDGYDKDGNVICTLTPKEGYKIQSLTLNIDNYILIEGQDYKYDTSTGRITIFKDVITKHPGTINIMPNFETAVVAIETNTSQVKQHYVGDKLDLAGIVITAKLSDGSSNLVDKKNVTFNPQEGTILDKAETKAISVTYKNFTGSFGLEVKTKGVIKVTSVEISADKHELLVGEQLQFGYEVLPKDADNPNVEWHFKVPAGSKVDAQIDGNGVFTAKAAGKIQVYATPSDDPKHERGVVSNFFDIEIKDKEILVTSVEITNNTKEVEEGETLELTTTVLPEDATNKELDWGVSGSGDGKAEIVKEDNKVYLKGVNKGTVTVTATAKDGSGKSDTKDFTVKAKVTKGEWVKAADKLCEKFVNSTTVYDINDISDVEINGKTGDIDNIKYDKGTSGVREFSIKLKTSNSIGFAGSDISGTSFESLLSDNGHFKINNDGSVEYQIDKDPEGEDHWVRSIKINQYGYLTYFEDVFLEGGEKFPSVQKATYNGDPVEPSISELKVVDEKGKVIDTIDVKKDRKINVKVLDQLGNNVTDKCTTTQGSCFSVYFETDHWVLSGTEVGKDNVRFNHTISGRDITLPVNVEEAEELVFTAIDDTTCSVSAGKDCPNEVVIPKTATVGEKELTVTEIASIGFSWKQITSIVLPETITKIDGAAFYKCSQLASIYLPDNLTSIGVDAFYGCEELKSITIPASVTTIDSNPFAACDNLVITVEQGNKNFEVGYEGKCLFDKGCTKLITCLNGEIDFSSLTTLTTIGNGACLNLNILEMIFPETLTTIEKCAFYEAVFKTEVHIVSSITTLEEGSFACNEAEGAEYFDVYIDSVEVAKSSNNDSKLFIGGTIAETYNRTFYFKDGITPSGRYLPGILVKDDTADPVSKFGNTYYKYIYKQ